MPLSCSSRHISAAASSPLMKALKVTMKLSMFAYMCEKSSGSSGTDGTGYAAEALFVLAPMCADPGPMEEAPPKALRCD